MRRGKAGVSAAMCASNPEIFPAGCLTHLSRVRSGIGGLPLEVFCELQQYRLDLCPSRIAPRAPRTLGSFDHTPIKRCSLAAALGFIQPVLRQPNVHPVETIRSRLPSTLGIVCILGNFLRLRAADGSCRAFDPLAPIYSPFLSIAGIASDSCHAYSFCHAEDV